MGVIVRLTSTQNLSRMSALTSLGREIVKKQGAIMPDIRRSTSQFSQIHDKSSQLHSSTFQATNGSTVHQFNGSGFQTTNGSTVQQFNSSGVQPNPFESSCISIMDKIVTEVHRNDMNVVVPKSQEMKSRASSQTSPQFINILEWNNTYHC